MLDDDFKMLRRSAIVIAPKQPFCDWLLQVFPEDAIPEMERQLYLIPLYDTTEQCEAWVKKNYAELFEEQLFLWCTDEGTYPKMSYKVFTEWFEVVVAPMGWDTQKGFIEKR